MRDNHDGLIELLEVSNDDNIYSCVISLTVGYEKLKLRFGINTTDYVNLLRISQFRPFENTAFTPYRYFFTGSYRKKENNMAALSIRVEQHRMHKNYEFDVTQTFVSNILWFYSVEDIELVKDLVV